MAESGEQPLLNLLLPLCRQHHGMGTPTGRPPVPSAMPSC